ncbi:hypothetical protein TeGR_g12386, partial [Tetraparma gracilis]
MFNYNIVVLYYLSIIWGSYSVGVRPVFSGDELRSEGAFLMANHQTMADCNIIFFVANKMKKLNSLKWFVKSSIRFLPGVGFALHFLDVIFVKRNWTQDKRTIERTFANLKKSKIKPVIVIFPEGTRQTAKKFKEARAFTVSRNMEPLRHLMHPRPRGFVATVTNMRDSLDSVVDVTIGFPEQGLPSLWQWFQGIGAKNTCIHCRRFPIADLPLDDEEALKRWLFGRFKEKDELLDRLYRTGSFEEGAGKERVDLETAESGRKGYGGNKVTP